MKESQTKGKPLRAKKVFSTEKFSFNKENTGKLRYTEQLSIAFCQLRLKNISPCKDVNLKQQNPRGWESLFVQMFSGCRNIYIIQQNCVYLTNGRFHVSVCLFSNNRWHQNVVRTKKLLTRCSQVLSTLWHHLWFVTMTVHTYGNKESICCTRWKGKNLFMVMWSMNLSSERS